MTTQQFTDDQIQSLVSLAIASPENFVIFSGALPAEVRETVADLVARQTEIKSFADSFAPQLHEAQRATEEATEVHKVLFDVAPRLAALIPVSEEKRGGGNKKQHVLRNMTVTGGTLSVTFRPE